MQKSSYDTFGVGHSSTSISAGLGVSLALRYQGREQTVACIIGDGAMTGGMAFEAMNDAVQQDADLLVILNDNDMLSNILVLFGVFFTAFSNAVGVGISG